MRVNLIYLFFELGCLLFFRCRSTIFYLFFERIKFFFNDLNKVRLVFYLLNEIIFMNNGKKCVKINFIFFIEMSTLHRKIMKFPNSNNCAQQWTIPLFYRGGFYQNKLSLVFLIKKLIK